MTNPRNDDFIDGRAEQTDGQEFNDSSPSNGVEAGSGGGRSSSVSASGVELAERLTNILVGEGDGDLLLQESDREDRVLEWLQALDMQVMGACRADERLKPLLKFNVSTCAVEDNLLLHLSQHFEPSEVGLLARCFCIPLVSIRVGKVNKQGTRLCPTDTRGNLNLTLLPTSSLRLSFIGDDGCPERLFTLSDKSQSSVLAIEEIQADSSGRSFFVKTLDRKVVYFWCSERSKLLGIELLTKMKDLLKRKPSIAELTGISEARLGCFATHLRAYLVGSTVSNTHSSSSGFGTITASTPELSDATQYVQSSSASSKCPRSRHIGSQAVKANSLYLSSLSPRSSSFKEGLTRNLCSVRTAREKIRRRGDTNVSAVADLITPSPVTADTVSTNLSENEKLQEDTKSCPLSPSFLESLGRSNISNITSPLFSPYYCWCPPGVSTLQYSASPPHLPLSSTEYTSIAPLPPLLQATRSTFLGPNPPLNLADLPPMDFPALLPDPMFRFPLPSSQQFPTFTPLMCDAIVHVPMIDVCSSGQGYLVSAGPTLSTTISPLHPKLVNPSIPETDVMDKGARETLRLLLRSSAQSTPQFMDLFPCVLTSIDEKQSMYVTGSRGLYSGARDVGAIANSIAAMSLVPLSGMAIGSSFLGRCNSSDNLDAQPPEPDSGGSCSDESGTMS